MCRCKSIKNKKNYSQCPRRTKNNAMFCGIHMKMKSPILFDETTYELIRNKQNENIINNNSSNVNDNTKSKVKSKSKKNKKYSGERLLEIKKRLATENIYTFDDLLDKSIPISVFKVDTIRNTIITMNLYNLIRVNQSKKVLLKKIEEYHNRMNDYNNNFLKQIIKIQSLIRGYLTRRSFNTVNDEDFFTCCTKYEIPKIYYFSFFDLEERQQYFFDIRSLYKLYIISVNDGKTLKNPYNMKEIPLDIISRMLERISIIDITEDCDVDFKNTEYSVESNIETMARELFMAIDRLNNYTDYKWFMDLTLSQLKRLYENSADIWYYRTGMTPQQRNQIISFEPVFTYNIRHIRRFTQTNIDQLRMIIISDFNRMISEGNTIDDKRTGAMLILTAMTTVSNDACLALPHFVQDF